MTNQIRNSHIVVLLTLLFTLSLFAQHNVAVLPFKNNGSSSMNFMSQGLADMFITSLSQTDGLTVVERSRVEDLMKEMEFSLTGIVDEKSAVELGKLLGANKIVFGSFMKLGSEIRIDARLVDVEKGSVVPGASRGATAKSLEEIDDVVDEISSGMAGKFGVASSNIKGDPSMNGELHFTFTKGGAFNPVVNGVPYVYDGTNECKFLLKQGKHHVQIVKGMFKPEIKVEEYVEVPGGYIVRMRYDVTANTLEMYDASPSQKLAEKQSKKESTALNKNSSSKNNTAQSNSTQNSSSETITMNMNGVGSISMNVITNNNFETTSQQSNSGTVQKTKPVKDETAPMESAKYERLKSQMKDEMFEDQRFGIMQSALKKENITCEQLAGLIRCFEFEDSQIQVAKYGYNRLIDKDDFYTVLPVFEFPFTRDELRMWADNQ